MSFSERNLVAFYTSWYLVNTYVNVEGKITGISYDMVWGGYDIYVED